MAYIGDGEMVQISNIITSSGFSSDNGQNVFINVMNRILVNKFPKKIRFRLTTGVIDLKPDTQYDMRLKVHKENSKNMLLDETVKIGPAPSDSSIFGNPSVFASATCSIDLNETGIYVIEADVENEEINEHSSLKSYFCVVSTRGESNG